LGRGWRATPHQLRDRGSAVSSHKIDIRCPVQWSVLKI